MQTQAKRQRELVRPRRGRRPPRLDQANSKEQEAEDSLAVLHQRIARVEASLGGKPDQPTDRYAAVREKQALRDRAALDLAYTEIKAPSAGIIVNFQLQLGEQVKAQTPLFALVTDRRPWLEANFKETELTHVTVGQKATVVLDMHPEITWDAEVESISPATGAEFAILPAQNASGNWVKVVQRLPVRLQLIERPSEPPLRAGMTAYVSIDTGRTRQLSGLFGGGPAAAANPEERKLPRRSNRRLAGGWSRSAAFAPRIASICRDDRRHGADASPREVLPMSKCYPSHPNRLQDHRGGNQGVSRATGAHPVWSANRMRNTEKALVIRGPFASGPFWKRECRRNRQLRLRIEKMRPARLG